MVETDLISFWKGELDLDTLAKKLSEARLEEPVNGAPILVAMNEDVVEEFEVTRKHLIKIVDAVLKRNLKEIDLNSIAFILILSQWYSWNGETEDGEVVSTSVFDWDSPESNFPLTRGNIKRWQTYLHTGEYSLSSSEQ